MLTDCNYFNKRTPLEKVFLKFSATFSKITFRITQQYCSWINNYVALDYTNDPFPFRMYKRSFPLRISAVNATRRKSEGNPKKTARFNEEIHNGKLHFLCSTKVWIYWALSKIFCTISLFKTMWWVSRFLMIIKLMEIAFPCKQFLKSVTLTESGTNDLICFDIKLVLEWKNSHWKTCDYSGNIKAPTCCVIQYCLLIWSSVEVRHLFEFGSIYQNKNRAQSN